MRKKGSTKPAQNRPGRKNATRGHDNDKQPSIAELLACLADPDPYVRRRGALELGRYGPKAAEAVEALVSALRNQEDAKLRKNAAIALGKIGADSAVQALATAAREEEMNWARPSMLLALGAIGGEAATKVLEAFEPRTEQDRDSLRRALGKNLSEEVFADWKQAPSNSVLLRVPVGLEAQAIAECREQGVSACKVQPGFLSVSRPVTEIPSARLRCIYEMLIPLSEADRPDQKAVGNWTPDTLMGLVGQLLERTDALRDWQNWLETSASSLRFRAFLNLGKARREQLRQVAELIRQQLAPFGCEDNPSAYLVELGLVALGSKVVLAIKPSFLPDERFAYRKKDVGASINPVVAACLVRLLGPRNGGMILDPTCGSGTLLVERAMLDPQAKLIGIDVSPTAISAARSNFQAAGVLGRSQLIQGNGADPQLWHKVALVAANLPFGMRVRGDAKGLPALYRAVVENVQRNLLPGGVALLYTANGKLLDEAIQQCWRGRKPVRLQTNSGGLSVMIRLLRR